MKFDKGILFLLCTPYAVHCLKVQSGSNLPGSRKQKALQLAEEICGRGVTVLDAAFEACDEDDQYGLFTDANLQLGPDFNNGIVLSSGQAVDVVGKNDNAYALDAFGHPGIQGLDNLLPSGRETVDGCALHITFDCQDHTHFGMEFVFGSDNYDCPTHVPTTNPYEDVMGIFVGDTKTQGVNIGLYEGKYISVNTLYGGDNFVENCPPPTQQVEMNGYTYPLKINNEEGQIVTGKNHLWIAVADGFDGVLPISLEDKKKPSWLFVRRNSLVCIDKGGAPKKHAGFKSCAIGALDDCGGVNPTGCHNWKCIDKSIQTQCTHPGTSQADHHAFKKQVRKTIRNSICRKYN